MVQVSIITVEAGPNSWQLYLQMPGHSNKDAAIGTDLNYTEASKKNV